MVNISDDAVERLAEHCEGCAASFDDDIRGPYQISREKLQTVAATLRAQAAEIERLHAKVSELGRAVNLAKYGEPDFAWSVHKAAMDDLRAQLATARREGAEEMREAVAEASYSYSRDRWWNENVAIATRDMIRALPLPGEKETDQESEPEQDHMPGL